MSERRCRFFQWNDLHARHDEAAAGGYPNANAKAAWAAACARGEVEGIEAPDFVVSAGDLIHGEIASFADDFSFLRQHVLAGLGVPLLPCLGNHENRQGEGVPDLNAAYDTAVGPGWHNYLYTVGGIAFIVVDTSGGHRGSDAVTAARHAFVERALGRAAGLPVVLVTHVPLVAMRREEALVPSFGFSSWKCVDDGVLRLVQRQADRVVAVLCGHIHVTGARAVEGIRHVMPSGTAGYPADFASFDVYEDRIEVQLHAAPAALVGDPSAGDIHGARRHGVDYTDADHPDHEAYVCGNDDERRFTIRLAGARRPDPRASCDLEVFHEDGPGAWRRVDLPSL